ncbi:gliding motility protein [Streptomyces sp. NRRL S-813]|uniref:gliding motility protein n=1 Tax=Streptomyces sp. NRRL S-813 TaxID=1463919 RepID=UPI000ACD3AE0|nr:gliding motility protein [Streptomyces sp. NRRL S-813]
MTVGPEVDGTAAAKGSAGADGGAEADAVKATDAEDVDPGADSTDGTDRAAADGVEIPKQQSTDEVAEQEAGEGART